MFKRKDLMTKVYQHVLLALDLSANALKLLDKTTVLAKCLQAELTVLHVIEPSLSAEHVYVDETNEKFKPNIYKLKSYYF